MKHHTKEKGDLGLAAVVFDLSKKGFKVLTPMSEHLPFDVCAYSVDTDTFYKVQCKYATKSKGCVEVRLCTSYLTKSGPISNRYSKGSFDVIAAYCPETEKVYYLSSTLTDKYSGSVTLRVDNIDPDQMYKYNVADNFLDFPEGIEMV